jgi:hypothetical protein
MKKIQFLKIFLFTIALTAITWSCEKTVTEMVEPQVFVSSNLVNQLTKEQLIAALNASGGSQAAILVRSGVKQYKIVYKTKNADGSEIQASGALIVPTDINTPLGLLSYQHGTIFNDQQAPSYFAPAGESSLVSLVASSGYLAISPDYIGYGSSNNVPHNYEHRATLARASLDMIRATKEFIAKEKLNWNNNLYIAGYSEGGFATMSLQKLIEEETGTEFNLKASSCGAGAYNKSLSFKTLVSTPSSGNPQHNASYIWV